MSSATVLTAQVTLTSTQLKAMQVTPIQLIAAPGANLSINPIWVTGQYKAGSVVYTNSSSATIFVSNNNAGTFSDVFSTPVAGFLDSTTPTNTQAICFLAPIEQFRLNLANVSNMPLASRLDHAITLGNGTLTLTIYYVLVPLV